MIRTSNTAVTKRLNIHDQKLPYELNEYNHTGIRPMRNDTADTANHKIANEGTRFLYLSIPIPIKREINAKTIANNTAINTRNHSPIPIVNINPTLVNATKKEKIPTIPVIIDIHPTTIKIVLRYG